MWWLVVDVAGPGDCWLASKWCWVTGLAPSSLLRGCLGGWWWRWVFVAVAVVAVFRPRGL